jgi:poly(A) polymerase
MHTGKLREHGLRIRYGNTPKGQLIRKAEVYTQKEHRIPPESIDPDALRVIGRLRRAGHSAYIVGGAVRDLLLGRKPKDFDIATDAHPRRIRRLFANSRIIGKRFRIVHIFFPQQKIFEVTTFRANPTLTEGDTPAEEFGTIEEDVQRRDFTINALYYDPFGREILDYVGGLRDIRERKLRTLRPAQESFLDDPVRMIRAVRYAGLAGFPLSLSQKRLIRRHRGRILGCSMERVTEEMYKTLKCGYSAPVMELAYRLKLLEVLMPALDRFLDQGTAQGKKMPGLWGLDELDAGIRRTPEAEIDRGEMLAALIGKLFEDWSAGIRDGDQRVEEPFSTSVQLLRSVVNPMRPSNRELQVAASVLLGAPVPAGAARPRAAAPAADRGRPSRARSRRPRRRVTGKRTNVAASPPAGAMQKPSPQTAHASSSRPRVGASSSRAEQGASAKQSRAGQESCLAALQEGEGGRRRKSSAGLNGRR